MVNPKSVGWPLYCAHQHVLVTLCDWERREYARNRLIRLGAEDN